MRRVLGGNRRIIRNKKSISADFYQNTTIPGRIRKSKSKVNSRDTIADDGTIPLYEGGNAESPSLPLPQILTACPNGAVSSASSEGTPSYAVSTVHVVGCVD